MAIQIMLWFLFVCNEQYIPAVFPFSVNQFKDQTSGCAHPKAGPVRQPPASDDLVNFMMLALPFEGARAFSVFAAGVTFYLRGMLIRSRVRIHLQR